MNARDRMPRTLVAVAAATALTLLATPAAADPPGSGIGDDGDIWGGGGIGVPGAPGSPGGGGSWSPPPGHVVISYPVFEASGGGEVCIATRWDVVPEADARRILEMNHMSFFRQYEARTASGAIAFEDCVGAPPIDITPALTWADSVVDQLPRPAMVMEPDARAITGNTAYLETGRPLTFGPVTRSLDLGALIGSVPVTIRGSGTYTVSWGDGTGPDSTTYAWPGSPYPGTGPAGEVSHTYIDTGTYTITTRDTWTVTFEVGDPRLSIDSQTETLTPRSLTVDVTQVRGVRQE